MAGGPRDLAPQSGSFVSAPLERSAEEGTWRCEVCTALNAGEPVAVPECRVCRASPAEGGSPGRAPEDVPARMPLWRVFPVMVIVLAAGLWLADLSPEPSPWAAATSGHGRMSAVAGTRTDVLRRATTDLLELAQELRSATARGEAVAATWRSRLAYTRARWRLYRDIEQFPGLEIQETALAGSVEELSSIGFKVSNGDDANTDLTALIDALHRIEESLSYAP